jgi:Pectate lyase superfamily protein
MYKERWKKPLIQLDQKHNPLYNKALLYKLIHEHSTVTIPEAINLSEKLFKDTCNTAEQKKFIHLACFPSITKSFHVKKVHYKDIQTTQWEVDRDENIFPSWLNKLDQENEKLYDQIKEEVNVKDFGAVGDGISDDTEAFRKAIGKGKVVVRIPGGTYITRGIKIPSWTVLLGEGKGKTTLRLHDEAVKSEWLITNKNHVKGNRNIAVKGMSLDWNVERLGNDEKTAAGNNRSSCVTFANVTYGWLFDLEAINPGLHCFDVSSSKYTYLGDGTRSRGGSRYIWLDNLNGSGFGDDGITTHHSEHIFISNSHMCDPSGRAHKKGFSNSNGIEIDDGSHNVWLLNNSTARCFGGIEIKAHHNASAATNVHIAGHLSVNDNRAYNFRHIGHHKDTDPASKTAHHISATNICAIAPVFTDLYKDSTPRALVVSGYNHVIINGFTLIGDPHYDYKKNPVIAIQYRARNVLLNQVYIKDFRSTGPAIKIFGGPHHADYITINNMTCDQYVTKPFAVGENVENATIDHVVIRTAKKETPIT